MTTSSLKNCVFAHAPGGQEPTIASAGFRTTTPVKNLPCTAPGIIRPVIFLGVFLLIPRQGLAQFSDTTPPHLVSLDFNPKSLDVTVSPQTVITTTRVTDDLSGTSYGVASFFSPSQRQTQFVF